MCKMQDAVRWRLSALRMEPESDVLYVTVKRIKGQSRGDKINSLQTSFAQQQVCPKVQPDIHTLVRASYILSESLGGEVKSC
jgi:hypothetical protein